VARGHAPHGTNYTITVLTTLSHPSGFVISNPRTATNTAIDFLAFLVQLVVDGHLTAGDVLICDNASIHFAAEIQAPLQLLLTATGIRLLFMPTYSPELNPCELVFAQIKNHLRHHRSHNHLLVDVAVACASISWFNILAYYNKCIYHFD
jgi:transposase